MSRLAPSEILTIELILVEELTTLLHVILMIRSLFLNTLKSEKLMPFC